MADSELDSFGAYIFESDECPCYPCRVSLIDAKVGERVLAINHEHLAVNTPLQIIRSYLRSNKCKCCKPFSE